MSSRLIRARSRARSEPALPRRRPRRLPARRARRTGARRSSVMAAVTATIARRSMTPITRRIAMSPAQHYVQWTPSRRRMAPGRASVRRQRSAEPGCLATAGELARLPPGELERAGHQDDRSDDDRDAAGPAPAAASQLPPSRRPGGTPPPRPRSRRRSSRRSPTPPATRGVSRRPSRRPSVRPRRGLRSRRFTPPIRIHANSASLRASEGPTNSRRIQRQTRQPG